MNYPDKYYTIEGLIERYPQLSSCGFEIEKACQLLVKSFKSGNKLLIAGNGGSCSDAEHIAGELMKGFRKKRHLDSELSLKILDIDKENGRELVEKLQKGLPVIALTNHQSLNTAFLNDVIDSGQLLFAQQICVYGSEGDVFLGISTSGNAENIYKAAILAKALNMKVIALTGADGGKIKNIADICIKVPETETFLVQELHLPVYHYICLKIEQELYPN